MHWLNEPASWSLRDGQLAVTADAGSDFWRTTGYGFVRDNGHVYGDTVTGDFELSMRVRGRYAAQYDQAGAMLRIDERCWLKTGVEYVEGRARFSTVVTRDFSNWAIADLPLSAGETGGSRAAGGTGELVLVVSRRGDAVEVRYAVDSGTPELAALVYLPPGREVLAGAMCAAPEGDGFEVTFRELSISPR